MLKQLSKVLFFVIFGKPIINAITGRVGFLALSAVDIYIRSKHGEELDDILENRKLEQQSTRRAFVSVAADDFDMRAIRYAELHEFDLALFMQNVASNLRKKVKEQS